MQVYSATSVTADNWLYN